MNTFKQSTELLTKIAQEGRKYIELGNLPETGTDILFTRALVGNYLREFTKTANFPGVKVITMGTIPTDPFLVLQWANKP